jgi:hypothetical protein
MTFTEVTPVAAAPPRVGSLLASVGVTPELDYRWVNGMQWRPEECFQGQTWALCATSGGTPAGGTDGGLSYYVPTGLRTEFTCGNRYGLNVPEELARSQRQLEAATSFLLASELWLGTATQADPYDTPQTSGAVNGYLADGHANVITGLFDPLEALGLLEEQARAALLGQQVNIHMPLVMLPQYGQILTERNGTLFTQSGAKVIADAGYDGSGPADAAATPGQVWMYATAPVQVRLAAIATYDFPSVANNTRTFVAERAAAATYDPCGHFAIAVSLPGDVTPPG